MTSERIPTREVRLSLDEIVLLADACKRRRRDLGRSIDRDSGVQWRQLQRKRSDYEKLESLEHDLEIARRACVRAWAEIVRGGMSD
jgi:hypothetical protein